MPRKIRSNYMEKFKFVYNGRTFESKHKCCNFYGICYRSVMAYQNQYKCRTEEAITHFIELKKKKQHVTAGITCCFLPPPRLFICLICMAPQSTKDGCILPIRFPVRTSVQSFP